MALEFSSRNAREARSGRRRLLAATVLVLVVLAADLLSGGTVRSVVRSGVGALWQGSTAVRSFVFESGYFSSKGALGRENDALRQELAQQREKAASYEVLREENDELRTLLSLRARESGITAPIVSSVRSSPYGTFLIGAGEADSVRAGDLVMTAGGFVIGRVAEVSERTALVSGVFAADSAVDVVIAGISASVSGSGGGNGRASVPRSVEVPVGAPVVAPSFGGRAIGTVGKVEADAASAEQTVYVGLPVNLLALRFVYVVHHE